MVYGFYNHTSLYILHNLVLNGFGGQNNIFDTDNQKNKIKKIEVKIKLEIKLKNSL
tara:strand:- start:357 stop:524 length:168 start_codon:yes stop_codon:yes gene_type:complete